MVKKWTDDSEPVHLCLPSRGDVVDKPAREVTQISVTVPASRSNLDLADFNPANLDSSPPVSNNSHWWRQHGQDCSRTPDKSTLHVPKSKGAHDVKSRRPIWTTLL